jgi:hypothetical protein
MGALGMTYFAPAGKDAFWKTNLAIMGQRILFQNDTLNSNMQEFLLNDEKYKENRMVLSSVWNKKVSSKLGFKTGIILTHIIYDLYRMTVNENTPIDSDGNTQTGQAYVQFRYRPTEKLTFNAGGHITYFTLNNQSAVEPRLGLKYQMSSRHAVMLAWGLHSKVLPLGNYFTRINGELPNIQANLLRSSHAVVGYEIIAGQQWKIRAEGYYQRLFDVPVARTPGSSWSILNTIDGFAKHELINTGTGENVGVDLILEKAFSQGTFVLLSGSIFDSKYTDASGRTFPTVFNSGFSATGMGGKEWTLKNGNQFILSGRGIYNGGQRLTPLKADGMVSRFSQEPELDDSNAFSEQVQAYLRFDMRLSFRKNNPKSSWWIAIDIQNVLNKRNIDALNRVYDPDLNSWVYREQSGLTPVLSFQIDF